MITLGGVTISDNMYLGGLIKANPIEYQQDRTVGGLSVMTVFDNPGGRNLTLGTSNLQGSIQGIWCQHVLDQVKVVQKQGNPVVLNYHGDAYNVIITDTSGIEQLFQFEPVSPDKKYVGEINLIEV